MSVVSIPRRVGVRRPARELTRPTTRRRPTHVASAPRRSAVATKLRGAASHRVAAVIVIVALMLSLAGSMVVANRQIQLHTLQSQLLQAQSTYAEQIGSWSGLSAPSQIATKAGALHLVDPTSVTQVASTSLDAPLPLPKFLGYAPATSRTLR